MSLNLIVTLQLTEKLCTDQQCDIYYMFYHFYAHIFLCSHGLGPPGTLSVGVVRTSVRLSEDQVKIFVQGRISRPSNGSKLIFHMRMYLYETSRNIQEPWHHDLYFTVNWLWTGQIIKVKIFVQGRISRPINGSKLLFHMRMYIYEISRNIQEPWPPDLYFMVCWLQTLTAFPWLRFLS